VRPPKLFEPGSENGGRVEDFVGFLLLFRKEITNTVWTWIAVSLVKQDTDADVVRSTNYSTKGLSGFPDCWYCQPVREPLLPPEPIFVGSVGRLDFGRGSVFDRDAGDDTPLLLDRFNWASHSMARMGTVGSGKSYHTKLELVRAAVAYDDLQIVVVDPKREYGRIIRRLDGTLHTLDEDEITEDAFNDSVVGFQVSERGDSENVDRLTDIVRRIYQVTSQDRTRTLVVVDEARILLEDETGRRALNQFVLEGRDVNTAVTLVTQSAHHFTDHRQGRGILDNMPAKTLFRHENVTASMVDYFDLSEREEQSLYRLKTGKESDYSEALMQVSGRLDAKLRIDATPAEKALFSQQEGDQ